MMVKKIPVLRLNRFQRYLRNIRIQHQNNHSNSLLFILSVHRLLINTIHVVIPFRNLEASVIHDATQSVVGQEYPKGRLQIVVYDDNSDLDGSKNILILSVILEKAQIMFLTSPSTPRKATTSMLAPNTSCLNTTLQLLILCRP